MKKLIFFAYCGLLFGVLSCNQANKVDNKNHLDDSIADSKTINPQQECVALPDMVFDIAHFGEKGISDGKELNNAEIENLQLPKMDTINISDYPDIKYFKLEELFESENGKVLLLSRTYEMEVKAWIAIYDKKNQLLDFRQIFYDEFAESIENTQSTIKENKIISTHYSFEMDSEKETNSKEEYCISSSLKFQKAD